jgi:hypothetical protein
MKLNEKDKNTLETVNLAIELFKQDNSKYL